MQPVPIRQVAHPVSGREYPAALCGAIAPLFTPERLDGKIDFEGLQALAEYLCACPQIGALMIRSGEGRMWSYSLEEVREAIRCVLDVARGRKPVIAGTAGIWDGTAENGPRPAVYFRRAAELSQWALLEGAAAVLQPVPAFLAPGDDFDAQDVVAQFFRDIARAVAGPIIIYNQDGLQPGYALSPQSLGELSMVENLLGVVYYTRDAGLLADIVRRCAPRFAVVAGCDSVAVPAFMSGAVSSAGAMATLVPEMIGAAWQSLLEPDLPFAFRAQNDLLRVRELLSPWPAADVGCALLSRQGVPMASRSRAPKRPPVREEVERIQRQITFLRAAYLG